MTMPPIDIQAPTMRPPRPRFVRRVMAFLLLGIIANVAVTLALSVWLNPFEGESTSLVAAIGVDDKWSVTRFERPGATGVISEHAAAVNWSYRQACGPPDTPVPGDQVTAWAPSSTDGAIEWLELDFAVAVRPASLKVYETYNPGGLFKVDAYRDDGSSFTAWEGTDPTKPNSGIGTSEVPLPIDFPIKTVRIWIDSPSIAGWNEIDAVGLVDKAGSVQWAVKARASSFYGQSNYAAIPAPPGTSASPTPDTLLPTFGGLGGSSEAVAAGGTNLERNVIAGFGWPMRSLWTPLPSTFGTTAVPANLPAYTLSIPPPASPATVTRTPLPFRPTWPGFAVNTLLYATIAFVLYWIAVKPRRFIAEVGRIRRGACLECGYDLGYDFIHGCPECGWRRKDRRV